MLTAALARYGHTTGLWVYGVAGTNLFLGDLPATPVSAQAITPKTAPASDFSDLRSEGVQIIVRRDTTSERVGYDAAMTIRDALHGLRHVTLDPGGVDETRLVWLKADDSGPLPLGKDSTGKQRWSLRFIAQTIHDTGLTIL